MLTFDDVGDRCRIVAESGKSAIIEVVNRPEGHNHVIADQVEGDAPHPGRVDIREDDEGLVAEWAVDKPRVDSLLWRLDRIE